MVFAAHVYSHSLIFRGHGIPMWVPEPSHFGEVQVGDVGYIRGGCFYRLFNIIRPKNHQMNAFGVPSGFTPLQVNLLSIHKTDTYLASGAVCSTSVKETVVETSAST